MTERTTRHSFIVRIYRYGIKNPAKLTGIVEPMDGSGERAPFTDVNELVALLRRGSGKKGKQKKT